MRVRFLVGTLFIQILLVLSTEAGWAVPCINPPATPEVISQFRQNPQAFVAPNSDTRTIEAFVRDLAGTDPSLAADFVRVATTTTPRFRTAIAAGLAQAAVACSTVDQHAGLIIQQSVASFPDGEFQAAFSAVAGDLDTAAITAAAASATASVGSVIVTNPNSGGRTTTNPGGGGSLNPIQITASSVSVSTANNNSPATAASQVSPTR